MRNPRPSTDGGARSPLHFPAVPRAVPYWTGLIPPGELPRRAVVVRLVLAVLLAVGLWVGVSNAQDPVETVSYSSITPTVKNPPGYYPVQQPPPVQVTVRGLRSDVKDLARPAAFVDLRGTSPTAKGPVTAPVEVAGLPAGVELRGISPGVVSLRLVRRASRTLPVADVTFGQLPPGYQAPSISITPPTVTVTGPEQVVKNIAKVQVVVNVAATQSLVREIEPQILDRSGQPVSRRVVLIRPPAVQVALTVHFHPLVQFQPLMPVVADIRGAVAPGYRISGVTVTPSLVQTFSSSPALTTTILTTPIQVDGWTSVHVVPVGLIAPAGISLPRSAQASVRIDVAPVAGSAVSTAGVLVVGKRQGTTVNIAPSTVTVTYQGPVPALNGAAAPRAVLDLHNRPPGIYYLTPAIALDRGLSLVQITPARLRVIITAPPQLHATATARPTATRPVATRPPLPTATRPPATARPRRGSRATPVPQKTAKAEALPATAYPR